MIDVLRRHRRNEVGRLDAERAIAEHREYWVPIMEAETMGLVRGEGEHEYLEVDRVIVFDDEFKLPRRALLVYTDEQRALRGAEHARTAGFALGTYAGPIEGTRVLSAIGDRELCVNYGCDPAERAILEVPDHVREWGHGVRVERAIETLGDAAWTAMEDHVWFVFARPDASQLATARSAFLIFTNADCAERLEPFANNLGFVVARIHGRDLFHRMVATDFVVNLAGPAVRVRGNPATRILSTLTG